MYDTQVITGGFELALACDILVGDASVVFRDTHCKFNLAPCWGLSQKLQRRIGPGRAKIMSLGAVPVKAPQAHAWGLLDEIALVEKSSLERSLEIADYIGKNASQMVVRYRKVMDQGGSVTLEEGLKRERALGLAHYIEAVGDGSTFSNAKEFITDEKRPRSKL
jgi:enoyl-CoA hydratase